MLHVTFIRQRALKTVSKGVSLRNGSKYPFYYARPYVTDYGLTLTSVIVIRVLRVISPGHCASFAPRVSSPCERYPLMKRLREICSADLITFVHNIMRPRRMVLVVSIARRLILRQGLNLPFAFRSPPVIISLSARGYNLINDSVGQLMDAVFSR